MEAPGIQPLVIPTPSSGPGDLRSGSAVIFTRVDTGIKTLSALRGRSLLLGTTDSTLTFWTKVHLVEAGIHARDLSKYRYVDSGVDLPPNGGRISNAPDLGNPFSPMTPVEAVIGRQYEAAVVTEERFQQMAAKNELVLLKRFSDTSSLLVGQSELPASAIASFKHAMTNLKPPHILQTFPGSPGGFHLCTDNDFSEMCEKLAAERLFDEN
jgi:hypothetical protein